MDNTGMVDPIVYGKIISDDIDTMKSMLDRIHEKTKTHLNKVEVIQYLSPVKSMITECFLDITSNGISFSKSE